MDIFTAVMVVEGQEHVKTEEEYIAACQQLIDTGVAWHLQGYFGRKCSQMIEDGFCHA